MPYLSPVAEQMTAVIEKFYINSLVVIGMDAVVVKVVPLRRDSTPLVGIDTL